jgi:four helix bundle protein
MATITKFEDLEIWQLARAQTNDFDVLVESTPLGKNYELRNQMDASSGSAMDCIAEGFDRSGNSEFKNFLIISKGSNAEFRLIYTVAWIENILLKKNLMNCTQKI